MFSENNDWYFVKPDGRFYKWDRGNDLTTSSMVEQFDESFHEDPNKLHDANASRSLELYQDLGLHFKQSYYQNWGGQNEKWMFSQSRGWYFITPDGGLYRWDQGSNFSTSTKVEQFDPTYHADAGKLHDPLASNARQLDQDLGLFAESSYFQDTWGQDEKWISSEFSGQYFILPDGGFYMWLGGDSLSNNRKVEQFDPSYYADPTKLHDASPDI